MSWLLERLGVVFMAFAAWSHALGAFFGRLACCCIVRAKPIPQPPPVPRIEWPAEDVPRLSTIRPPRDDRETLPDIPAAAPSQPRVPVLFVSCPHKGSRVHADLWMRAGGVA